MKLAAVFIGTALLAFAQISIKFALSTLDYKDENLHFTYHYPAEFGLPASGQASLDNIRRTTPDQGLQKTVSCMTIPLSLKGPPAGTYDRFLLFKTDYDCMKRDMPESLPRFTNSTMTDLMKGYGQLSHGSPVSYQLEGHSAAYISAQADANSIRPGMILYAAESCVIFDKTIVCWNILTSDQAKLSKLFPGTIVFDGHPDQLLVPSDIILKQGH